MEEQEFDREKKGYFWIETESTVVRKGTFVINGVKHYGAIVESFNKDGEKKHEFMMSLGLLHINKDPRSDDSPAMSGRITHNGNVYKLGCWPKENRDGTPFTSLGFKPVDDDEQRVSGHKADF